MSNENEKQIQVTEDDVVDFALQYLYAHMHKNEIHLEQEILAKGNIKVDADGVERLRELIMHTNLVNASIGFGKAGFIYLNQSGLQIMKQYKTYHNYLASQLNPNLTNTSISKTPSKKSTKKIDKNHQDFLNSVNEDD
jgi:hypothetical protein